MAPHLAPKISRYISSIPPVKKNISDAIILVKENKLAEAALLIEKDIAIKAYILRKAASPVFSFIDRPRTVSHALSLFGAPISVAMLENYLLESLTPKKWQIFNLTTEQYQSLQTDLIASWQKILDKVCKQKAKSYISAATLLTSAIAICEGILSGGGEEVSMLESQGLKYNDILARLGGLSLYKIAAKAGSILGFEKQAINLVQLAENPTRNEDEDDKLAKYLHLLLFYKLSQPFAIEAKLDDFATCNSLAVEDDTENFFSLLEVNFED